MKSAVWEIKKHLRIYLLFMKNCLIAQMEYRFNFISAIIFESIFIITWILYTVVIYRTGITINGMTPDMILLFTGTYTIMTAFYNGLLTVNHWRFPEYIREGTLDLYMTKPVSLQFITTLRYIDFGYPIPDLAAGLIMVAIGWKRIGIELSLVKISGYLGLMFCGSLVIYATSLLPLLLCFKTVKVGGLYNILYGFWDINRMPLNIYDKWIQRIGIFIFPVFLISNFAVLYVLGKLPAGYIIWGIGGSLLFLAVARFLWNNAVRSYTSACS